MKGKRQTAQRYVFGYDIWSFVPEARYTIAPQTLPYYLCKALYEAVGISFLPLPSILGVPTPLPRVFPVFSLEALLYYQS